MTLRRMHDARIGQCLNHRCKGSTRRTLKPAAKDPGPNEWNAALGAGRIGILAALEARVALGLVGLVAALSKSNRSLLIIVSSKPSTALADR